MKCLVAYIIILCYPLTTINAQCPGGGIISVVTYDSTVNGLGNAPYHFTFPKFNPALGTLTEIRIQSVVSLRYSFTLENTISSPNNVRHFLNRYDDIYSSAFVDPINAFRASPLYGPYNLAPNDGVPGSGPDFRAVGPIMVLNNDTAVNTTMNNSADFLGPGDVTFDYYTSPGPGFMGAAPTYNNVINDIVKFNISYVYCNTLILASNTLSITADNSGPLQATVRWTSTNESKAKSYEVMVSEDGKNFTTAAIVPASGTFNNDNGIYEYKYTLTKTSTKLYFRVKQTTKENRQAISAIRPVMWAAFTSTPYFRPDPSGLGFIAQLPNGGGGFWKVDLFSINGQLLEKNQVTSGIATTMQTKTKLQNGVYVIRATNSATNDIITQKVLIQ